MNELMKRYERETGESAIIALSDSGKNVYRPAFTAWLAKQLTTIPATERLPDKDQEVLAHYKSRYGRECVVRAEYFRKFQEVASDDCEPEDCDYDEAKDEYYVTEGWYELIDNWGDYSSVRIVEGAVDSWLPMPKM